MFQTGTPTLSLLADEEQTKQLISLAEFDKEPMIQLLSKLQDMEFDWKITNALLYYIGKSKVAHKVALIRDNWRTLCMAREYANDVVFIFPS